MAEPQPPLLRRRMQLGAAQEDVASGTFATMTDPMVATSIYDAQLDLVNVYDDGKRAPLGIHLGHVLAAPGVLGARLSFRNEIRPGDQTLPLLTGAGMTSAAGTYATSSMVEKPS